ncbi:S-layer homology domain-containing protein [Paenibacillus thailandensis]|uniref:S-layer homology domain-containing protein n=1 Tax=Paenibacillus thailandensis TaxID=393250 RepID=A0ABW5R383_9BACL
MTNKWKCLMLSAALLTASVPAAAFAIPANTVSAAAPAIAVDRTSVTPGSPVAVTGTYDASSWISLRAVDAAGNLVVFDATRTNEQGEYRFTFDVPFDTAPGTLVLYAGSGDDVANASVQVRSYSGSNDDDDDDDDGNDSGSGASQGNVPSGTGEGSITYRATAADNADGRAQASVVIDEQEVRSALADNAGILKIRIEADNAEVFQSTLQSEAVRLLLETNHNMVVQIVTSLGTYTLPLSAPEEEDFADADLRITIGKATADQADAVRDWADANGAELISDVIDFQAEAVTGGSGAPIDFGNNYVERSIPLSGQVNPDRAAGVRFDETKRALAFVPALFGYAAATLKSTGNSLYAVIESDKSFEDVPAGFWGEADIEQLASKLVLNGLTEDTFGPNETLTRAQFAAMIVRGLGLQERGTAPFSDVTAGEWYAGAVGAAYEAGIVSGYEDGTFRPNERITRQELAVLIDNAVSFASGGETENAAGAPERFRDQEAISPWARTAVANVAEAGISEGRNGGYFDPAANSTRAEAAAMLKRLLVHVGFID